MRVKLAECVELLDSKRVPLSSKEREKLKKIYPYYGAQGIIDYVDSYIFNGNYILVAEDGNNLKTLKDPVATWATDKFWVNNHAHILGERNCCNLRYIFYLLNSIDISKYVTGSAQPKLNQENLLSIEIDIPDRKTQDKIVEILSGIDAQIERNNEIVKRLQVLGNTIYSDTFKYCNATCSLIEFPYIRLIKQGINEFTGEKHYIATSDVTNDNLNFDAQKITFDNREGRANMQPVKNSVWFAQMKNSIKHIFISENDDHLVDNYVFSTGFYGFECDEIAYEFMVGTLSLPYFEQIKDKMANGAIMASINSDNLNLIKIPMPTKGQLYLYHEKTKDIYKQISAIKTENYKLSKLKEKLLPLLINGQLSV